MAVITTNLSMPGQVGVQGYRSTNQTITTITYTTVVFDTVTYNVGSAYNTGTGIFTCPESGKYLVTGNVMWNTTGASASYYIFIFKTTTAPATTEMTRSHMNIPAICDKLNMNTTAIIDCAATDTLYIQVYHASGGNKNITADGRVLNFSIMKIA